MSKHCIEILFQWNFFWRFFRVALESNLESYRMWNSHFYLVNCVIKHTSGIDRWFHIRLLSCSIQKCHLFIYFHPDVTSSGLAFATSVLFFSNKKNELTQLDNENTYRFGNSFRYKSISSMSRLEPHSHDSNRLSQ